MGRLAQTLGPTEPPLPTASVKTNTLQMQPYELFEILARTTWNSVNRCHRLRIQLGEDSITSVNLSAIASHKTKCVVVEDTRVNEATRGCDFELWVGSSRLGWARYAIQAKKINPNTNRYGKLGHKVGGTLQIDILDRYATANRAAPIYCFFNSSLDAYSWSCKLADEREQLGCTVTPSHIVRRSLNIRGARNFSSMHHSVETLPWRCLVRCPQLIGSSPNQRKGWLPRSSYRHASLPIEMKLLQERRSMAALDNPLTLYSPDSPLRPAWVGVIDISDSESGA